MYEFIVETDQLDYSFMPSQKILHSLNLRVPKGSIYCFLGPNGAGKTTTLRALLGLLKTNPREVSIFGQPLMPNRISILKRIGSLIEQPSLYGHLTGRENLEVFRLSYSCEKKRIKEVLEITGLHDARNQVVRTYSFGMKQRLAIALALLQDPELLILDEPTNGLDPQGIIETRQLIKRLHQEFNKTILISSHLLSEVEKIATHFGILHKGRLLFQGTHPALQELRSDNATFEIEAGDIDRALVLLENKFVARKMDDSTLCVERISKDQTPDLIEFLVQQKIRIYKAGFIRTNLEDQFIQIITS
jgi:ABC-2 type transport system ATP-binding protein